jgi:hypothetical protein
MSGHNCPLCDKTITLTNEQFIKNAIAVHGNKYDYSKSIYIKGGKKSSLFVVSTANFYKHHIHTLPVNVVVPYVIL